MAAKILTLDYSEIGSTVYCIIRREVDSFRLNDVDGNFAAAPGDPYLSLTEDSVIKGRYEVSEDRQTWDDGKYTVAIYKQAGGSPVPASDLPIGSGKLTSENNIEVTQSGDTFALAEGATGFAAIDTVVDGIQTDLSNGTDGLGALKTLIDAVNTDLSNGTDGLGALKTLIDTVNTDLSNGTDGLGALKTLIDTMQGNVTAILTDTGTTLPATLATIASYIDTEVQAIIDDLANGTDGLGALKALIDGLNDISAADVNAQCDAAIETYGLDHLVSAAVIGADIADDSIIAFLASKSGTADWDSYDNTTDSLEAISDSGGGGPTATQIVDEWETQSQADPTGFHVNVKEVNGTSQTANDHGADFATLLTNVAAILTDTGTTLPATLATIAAYIDTEVQAIIDDLANGTDGLGALKTLIDAVNTDLSNGTDGLGALKALIDAVGVDAARLTAVRAAVLTDLIDGNRLDLLIDAIKLVTDAQARAADTIMDGAAVSGTLSTTEMTTGLTVTVADQYNGRQLIFADDTTTAALRGQATAISATTVSGSKLGFTALTTAPVVGDTFSIV